MKVNGKKPDAKIVATITQTRSAKQLWANYAVSVSEQALEPPVAPLKYNALVFTVRCAMVAAGHSREVCGGCAVYAAMVESRDNHWRHRSVQVRMGTNT